MVPFPDMVYMEDDSDVNTSCHLYASCFSAMTWDKRLEIFVIVASLS